MDAGAGYVVYDTLSNFPLDLIRIMFDYCGNDLPDSKFDDALQGVRRQLFFVTRLIHRHFDEFPNLSPKADAYRVISLAIYGGMPAMSAVESREMRRKEKKDDPSVYIHNLHGGWGHYDDRGAWFSIDNWFDFFGVEKCKRRYVDLSISARLIIEENEHRAIQRRRLVHGSIEASTQPSIIPEGWRLRSGGPNKRRVHELQDDIGQSFNGMWPVQTGQVLWSEVPGRKLRPARTDLRERPVKRLRTH